MWLTYGLQNAKLWNKIWWPSYGAVVVRLHTRLTNEIVLCPCCAFLVNSGLFTVCFSQINNWTVNVVLTKRWMTKATECKWMWTMKGLMPGQMNARQMPEDNEATDSTTELQYGSTTTTKPKVKLLGVEYGCMCGTSGLQLVPPRGDTADNLRNGCKPNVFLEPGTISHKKSIYKLKEPIN